LNRREAKKEWRRRMRTMLPVPGLRSRAETLRAAGRAATRLPLLLPFSNVVKEKCWAREHLPQENIGW